MNPRRAVIAVGIAAGAVVGAALFASPAAYADDDELLNISGLSGPIGQPTNVQNVLDPPLFIYHQEDDAYQVVNSSDSVIGQFTDTHSGFASPATPPFLWPLELEVHHDVISNSTYSGLADGATETNTGLFIFTNIPIQGVGDVTGELVGNDYVNDPGIANSDILWLLNVPITLWDVPVDPAAGAAADSSWLADLAAPL